MHNPINLSTPFQLSSSVVLPNRIVKSALSEVLADKDGNPNKSHINLYKCWAEGGAALLITGNMMVDRNNTAEPHNVVLDEKSNLAAFEAWAAAVSNSGTHLWAQLNHPGKQTPYYIVWEPVAPSAIALTGGLKAGFNKPRALKQDEIINIIRQFATSARLAKQAGFSGVQIHAAHGYLINQFLSPLHNQRQDQWGGSLENRQRFLVEIYHAIRHEVGADFPIAVKLNSADFQRGGFNEEDFISVVETLANIGIDLIEISGGNYESQSMSGANVQTSTIEREAYFLEYARKIRDRVKVPLMVTGGFRSASAMNQALQIGETDLIGLGRPFAIDPNVANKLLCNSNYKVGIRQLSTGIKYLDQLTLINITWYEHQLARMAKNQTTQPNLSPWLSIVKTVQSAGIYRLSKRRI
ncbi:NADH:flavin oxidoreductase/NADH oxidase family protein [Acinetobacter halotolerans]|uniref:NADH:flavin oxidoreductase/NADH oxidase family protein n=1 Tax=Acinetobacter halotolerans TaxID=1752076 RepID=A0A4Q6XC61_9GAMM|nr:NADH:flavin oxidoreductase/NADH oxidase family protein [Acinetobacter halotolerans]RZF55992.1 NADH:flavin oxidoreductase/NADH oxidase family protein [Acinetobacter halotolerans]